MPEDKWARLLGSVTGLINQKLLLQNEYLAAENRIRRAHLPARMRLSDPERSTLPEIGKRLTRVRATFSSSFSTRTLSSQSTAVLCRDRLGGFFSSTPVSLDSFTTGPCENRSDDE
jgi:hypothetical protein